MQTTLRFGRGTTPCSPVSVILPNCVLIDFMQLVLDGARQNAELPLVGLRHPFVLD